MAIEANNVNGNTTNGVTVAASELSLRGAVAADAPNAIEVDHIVKRYGEFLAVDDISFAVKEAEIFGLLGPNGAGKSTLIRMMTTLIPISSGSARVAGHDVARDPSAVRQAIGVIPQALTSDLDLTVEENLNIYAKLYDVPAKRRKESIDDLLETVDLTKWRGAQTKTLSGGMRRRLEIARGLVHSPKIFFLDEPTTGLDPVSRVAVWEMLTNIKAKRKLTILITTHYMDEADRLCNRIAIVDHGKLVALDTSRGPEGQRSGIDRDRSAVRAAARRLATTAAGIAGSDIGAERELRNVPRAHLEWLGHNDRSCRNGGGSQSRAEDADGAEHYFGRCVCPLHGTPIAR